MTARSRRETAYFKYPVRIKGLDRCVPLKDSDGIVAKLKKTTMTFEQQLANEEARRALSPITARQIISEQHDSPEFHLNRERLRAERLAREAQTKRPGTSDLNRKEV